MGPDPQHEGVGPIPGFRPILEPERCKLQCSGHVGFWGALREPSVPYNWTSGAFGTFGPICPHGREGLLFWNAAQAPRGGARRIPVASRKPPRAEAKAIRKMQRAVRDA